jgi:glycosyltransferase involved in cell wall biosynthesis
VNWHGRTDPAPFYGAASILIVPSIWPENAPYVVLEGMTRGLTVIAAASGGIPEQIDDGRTGLLFTPGDGAGFTGQLGRAISNLTLRRTLGESARAATAAYGWRRIVEAHLGMYTMIRSHPSYATGRLPRLGAA